jgi:hypothetical protein
VWHCHREIALLCYCYCVFYLFIVVLSYIPFFAPEALHWSSFPQKNWKMSGDVTSIWYLVIGGDCRCGSYHLSNQNQEENSDNMWQWCMLKGNISHHHPWHFFPGHFCNSARQGATSSAYHCCCYQYHYPWILENNNIVLYHKRINIVIDGVWSLKQQ